MNASSDIDMSGWHGFLMPVARVKCTEAKRDCTVDGKNFWW